MKAQDLRGGNAIDLDGQLWVVVDVDHVKPGKGPAYAQVKLKNVKTGANVEKRFRSNEEVNRVDLDRRSMEFLYADASGAVFMDTETFEQHTIPSDVLGEAAKFIKPNTAITALVYGENVITVELPSAVDLKVESTPPGIKGATAHTQLKEATLETGLQTKVPPFISDGDVVRVSTETGEYLSRVSS
ncbi:MAG: elongation factor P [bacterium]